VNNVNHDILGLSRSEHMWGRRWPRTILAHEPHGLRVRVQRRLVGVHRAVAAPTEAMRTLGVLVREAVKDNL
jgi:hypothetical protein